MPDLQIELKHLGLLNELIANAELRIDEQRKLVAELQRNGHPTALAERLLTTMEESVAAEETRLIVEATFGSYQGGIAAANQLIASRRVVSSPSASSL